MAGRREHASARHVGIASRVPCVSDPRSLVQRLGIATGGLPSSSRVGGQGVLRAMWILYRPRRRSEAAVA